MMALVSDSNNIIPENNSDALLYGGFEDPKIVMKLGTVAAKIAYHNFEWRYVTLVMYNTMLHIGVKSFLKNYNKSIYLKLGKFVPRHRVHVPQFVLFGQDDREIIENLDWLRNVKYDNTGMYILVCTSNYDSCNKKVIFQFLSRNYFVNSIFLKSSKDTLNVKVFAYHPVLPNNCRNEKPIELNLRCENEKCFKDLYPEKLKNLHKCPFVVSTIEQPPLMYLHNGTRAPSGGDGDVLRVLINILNATLIVTSPPMSEGFGYFKHNNWTGPLGDVYNNRAHASMCSAPLTPQIYGNFQISFTYNSIDIVWVARLPSLMPSWEKLFHPLKIHIRVALCFMFIVIICMNTFIKTKFAKRIGGVLNIVPTQVSLFFYSWAVSVGMPLLKLPSKSALRAIVINFIWFCYIVRTAYQAILISSMKSFLYEEYLESFQDVLRKNYPYGGLYLVRDYYSDDLKIFNKWVPVELSVYPDVFHDLIDGSSDFVIASNIDILLEYLKRYNGARRLQIIPEKILNSPAVIYFKKFNPFRPAISRVLSTMMEAGIIDMLYAQYMDRSDYLFRQQTESGVAALTLSNVSGSLMILFCGWTLSIVYFLIEIVSKKFERPKTTISTEDNVLS